MSGISKERLMLHLSGASRKVPVERISHAGIQPFAFDGVKALASVSDHGLLLTLDYSLGPNFDAILKRRYPEEGFVKVQGGFVFFREPASWGLVGQVLAGRPMPFHEAMGAGAAAGSPSFQAAFLERLTQLTIRVPEDDPEAIEFRLCFGTDLTLEERVARPDWSDIYPWPPDTSVPAPIPPKRRRGRPPKWA